MNVAIAEQDCPGLELAPDAWSREAYDSRFLAGRASEPLNVVVSWAGGARR